MRISITSRCTSIARISSSGDHETPSFLPIHSIVHKKALSTFCLLELARDGAVSSDEQSPKKFWRNPIIMTSLQRRLSLAIAQGSSNLVSSVLGAGSQELASGLSHVVLLLHGGKLLVLGKG